MRNFKDVEIYKDITQEQWDNWEWQVSNRIVDVETLKKVANITQEEEEGIKKTLKMLKTSYYTL